MHKMTGEDSARETVSDSGGKPGGVSRARDLLFRVQKFVVERAWSLLLLTVLSEIGAFVLHKLWEIRPATGRATVQTLLLVAGLVAFWMWPGRARFMVRLSFLLIFAGLVLLVLTWVITLATGEAKQQGLIDSVLSYWSGEIGRNWLVSGLILAILMWGGRAMFRAWRTSPVEKARRADGRRAGDSDAGGEP